MNIHKNTFITAFLGLVVVAIALSGGFYLNSINNGKHSSSISYGQKNPEQQKAKSDSINLISGKSYLAGVPVMLHFELTDYNGKTIKQLDEVHEKKLHLIVVRKDRMYFQHVHPTFDEKSGSFMLEPFTFPSDGEYRIYAEYTPTNAAQDDHDMKQATVVYQDVQAGDISKYKPENIGEDKFNSQTNGLQTKLRLIEGEDGPGIGYVSGIPLSLGVDINKEGEAFKELQKYLGALGHMVILGPKLEYIHAHALSESTANQTGFLLFSATLPTEGQYKVYLQTQASDQVNTTDYTVTAKANPYTNSGTGSNSGGMPHNGH